MGYARVRVNILAGTAERKALGAFRQLSELSGSLSSSLPCSDQEVSGRCGLCVYALVHTM